MILNIIHSIINKIYNDINDILNSYKNMIYASYKENYITTY
jgi:hypothetical protein